MTTRSSICVHLAAAIALFSAPAVAQRTVTVQLLAINDLHGNLEPPSGSGGMVNRIPAGGTEYLATHLANARRDNPNSILVGAGDIFGGSPLLSSLSTDEPAIESANALGLELTALGNHELDHGPAALQQQLRSAKFHYLAANAVVTSTGATLFPATAIRTIGGVKIGFIGEILEDAPKVIAASSIRDLRFLEEAQAANSAAARLEKQGVHTIVLLIHEGGRQQATTEGGDRDTNGCQNFTGEIATLAEKLSPSIGVVISGHTHEFYNCRLNGHLVTSAGHYGRLFTRISLTIDTHTDKPLNITATNEVVTRDVPKDPQQTAIIERFRPGAEKIANQPGGAISASITRKENAAGESALGDLIADAQLAATSSPENGGAQIAFMNSGGMRADLVKPPDATSPFPVRFADLYAVQPFGNQLTVHTMTGDTLRRLLEQQFSPDGHAHMMQTSGSFTYSYRLHAEPGQHIIASSMMLNGKPIAPTDTLRIEASDYMAAGAEGLTVFREGTNPTIGHADVQALTGYVKTHSPVAPGPQNRITRAD